MTRLTKDKVLALQKAVAKRTGVESPSPDAAALESALAAPFARGAVALQHAAHRHVHALVVREVERTRLDAVHHVCRTVVAEYEHTPPRVNLSRDGREVLVCLRDGDDLPCGYFHRPLTFSLVVPCG